MTKDYANIYLNVLMFTAATVSAMDAMQGTNAYRHSLKKTGEHFKKELEKLLDNEAEHYWGVDDKVLYSNIGYKENLIKKIIETPCHDHGVIAEIIDIYLTQPEAVLEALKIKITETS